MSEKLSEFQKMIAIGEYVTSGMRKAFKNTDKQKEITRLLFSVEGENSDSFTIGTNVEEIVESLVYIELARIQQFILFNELMDSLDIDSSSWQESCLTSFLTAYSNFESDPEHRRLARELYSIRVDFKAIAEMLKCINDHKTKFKKDDSCSECDDTSCEHNPKHEDTQDE